MSDKAKTIDEEFDEMEELFPSEEDKERVRGNKILYKEAQNLYSLSESPGGRALIKGLKNDISDTIKKLIETREGRYISDLDSQLSLLTKLTDAKKQTDAIRNWIDSIDK